MMKTRPELTLLNHRQCPQNSRELADLIWSMGTAAVQARQCIISRSTTNEFFAPCQRSQNDSLVFNAPLANSFHFYYEASIQGASTSNFNVNISLENEIGVDRSLYRNRI